MPINAIFFDAGNTLIFLDHRIVLPVLEKHGIESNEARFRRAELNARAQLMKRVEEGAFGTEAHIWQEYFSRLFQDSGVPGHQVHAVGEEVKGLHQERHLWTFLPASVEPALARLSEAGYRMAVISNADGRVEALIRDAGLMGFFEFVMDSEVEGVEKPDPEIFLRACRRMGVGPEESLYVGDLYPVDVLGARSVGMKAVLLDPGGDLDYPVDTIPSVRFLPDYISGLFQRG